MFHALPRRLSSLPSVPFITSPDVFHPLPQHFSSSLSVFHPLPRRLSSPPSISFFPSIGTFHPLPQRLSSPPQAFLVLSSVCFLSLLFLPDFHSFSSFSTNRFIISHTQRFISFPLFFAAPHKQNSPPLTFPNLTQGHITNSVFDNPL